MSSANRLIVSMLVVAALAVAFWVLALGPKRQEASALAGQVGQLRATLAKSQLKATEAVSARRDFPTDYQQLVVLGKAVPNSDETSSLLVVLNRIANHANLRFNSIALGSGSGGGAPASPPATTTPVAPAGGSPSAEATAATVPPTEASASLLPLGATIGPAGLGVMPYNLTFSGNFADVADFIRGIDSLVHSGGRNVAVDGRLVTLNGFSLNEDPERSFPYLECNLLCDYLPDPTKPGRHGRCYRSRSHGLDRRTDGGHHILKRSSDPSSTPVSNPRNEHAQERPRDKAFGRCGSPDALVDLFYDLRDRHLLPLVAVLAVAIVAVPIALSQNSGSENSAANTRMALALPSSVANPTRQLVVAKSTPGIRVYRRRLTNLRAKDPFKQQYTKSESTSATGSSLGSGSPSGGESSTSTASAPPSSPGTSTSPETESHSPPATGRLTYFSYAIDVRVVPGHSPSEGGASTKKSKPSVRRNVPELTMLPSRKTPAAIFMGVSKDGDKALLLLSSEVDSIFGEGQCLLGSANCQLLALEPGSPETLVYGPRDRSFKIELLKVHFVISKTPHRAPLRGTG